MPEAGYLTGNLTLPIESKAQLIQLRCADKLRIPLTVSDNGANAAAGMQCLNLVGCLPCAAIYHSHTEGSRAALRARGNPRGPCSFRSRPRDDRPESDIDILVEFEPVAEGPSTNMSA